MYTRRTFCSQIAGLTGLALAPASLRAATPDRKPNIVIFLIDDMGWGDLGCYGDTFHRTPNINRLAKESMRFTNGYAGAPVCSPSRAAILTGQAPARLHLTQWIPGTFYPHKKLLEAPTPKHLDLSVPTIARLLKKSGYQTAAIGKWHLGGEGYLPEDFGFDVNVAGDNHGHPPSYFGPFHFHNLTGYTPENYLTDVLTTKMDDYLSDAAKKGPFFLYMAEYSVHGPLQAKKPMIEQYRHRNGGKDEPDPTYAAMIESTDIALGSLRKSLERAGVADNTIIILTSDNGGVGFQGRRLHRIADNGPYRAGKGFLYEGGIREPFMVYWPGVTRAGAVSDVPVSALDLMPTILQMAGAGAPPNPHDGLDLTSFLRGGPPPDRDTLYWHYPHYSDQGGTPSSAIRQKNWKLIEFFEDNHLELYNLAQDPGEQYNFASTYQDKAYVLHEKLLAWRDSVHAVMPTPNPGYNPELANLREGPAGCSWLPGPACVED